MSRSYEIGRFCEHKIYLYKEDFDSFIESDPKLKEGVGIVAPAVAVAKLAWSQVD